MDLGADDTHDLNEIGKRIILPSSYLGSSRSMYQLYQDSMALACYFHKVDYFITMTANPNWPEIKNALLPGQQPSDRPDIIARVFNLKRNAFLDDLTKGGYLGHVLGYVYTIEFQKRGLPHMHLLLFIDHNSRPKEPADIDKIISAEFPDPDIEPELFNLVLQNMTHGPCDQRCQVNGKYSKRFPKTFRDATSMDQNAYVSYRRRDTGKTFCCHPNKPYDPKYDNCWVVPYNKVFLLSYQCHINIECCASIKSVKYIHKYIYKGHDRITMVIEDTLDEVKIYLDSRYISAPEGIWRLLELKMYAEVPKIY